ncbi:hypothetical protein [Desulfitobacterium sp. AusDCA]|uniref:hypothetical protein n=1 Tax=Desulfitobacterium sp. AusDCA TaxID=3240383 RepID=UPI003DA6FE50
MKKALIILLLILLSLQCFSGPVWAAEAYPAAISSSTVAALGLPDIMGAINEVKTSIGSVVDFFTHFDPGKMVNDWIQKSLGDLLKPLISWSEKNSAQYPYVETTDPQFTWWTFLAFFGLIVFMFAGLRQIKQIMNGERPIRDFAIFFGLMAGMFASIWLTNRMVHLRNQFAYVFMTWMTDMKWLVMDPVQSSTEFIIPDLAKSIIWVNQDAVSSILSFMLGGLVMLIYELLQMFVYGTWLLLVVGSPFFLAATAWSDNYSPLISYLNGLVRTLITSILIIFGWGIQAYVYTNVMDTSIQIIIQAVSVVISILFIYMFWGKFIIVEVFGMLYHPVQTIRGNVTSKMGSGLKISGKLAGLTGLVTGHPGMASVGNQMEKMGEMAESQGEKIKMQAAGRGQVRYQDEFSRIFQRSVDTGGRQAAASSSSQPIPSKFTVSKPNQVVTPSQSLHSFSATLDQAKDHFIPKPVHDLFVNTSTPGGGHFFKYTGPEEEQIAKQLKDKKIPIQKIDGHIAVDRIHGDVAKQIVAQTLKGRQHYWIDPARDEDGNRKEANVVTVNKLGITRHQSAPPTNGINMGAWMKNKTAPNKEDVPKNGPTKPPSIPGEKEGK